MEKIGRKVYHACGGLILLWLYYTLGRTPGLLSLSGLLLFATCLDYARLRVPAFNEFMFSNFGRFIRNSERTTLTGTPPYILGILLTLTLYSFHVAVYSVAFLAFGDVAATTVGENWGTIKIFGGKKSLQGTAAFAVTAVFIGFVLNTYLYALDPAVFVAGAFTAAIVEILPVRINDNLTIPIVSGAVMELFSRLV